jgi:hypothetical protein
MNRILESRQVTLASMVALLAHVGLLSMVLT